MTLNKNFTEFRDFNISFDPHPNTGDLMMSRGKKSVAQSIITLLYTQLGERIIEKDVGSSVSDFLFDFPTSSIMSDIREEIKRTILENEPRVRFVDINMEIAPDKRNYIVEIMYVDTEVTSNESLEFEDYERLNLFLPIS